MVDRATTVVELLAIVAIVAGGVLVFGAGGGLIAAGVIGLLVSRSVTG